MGPPRGYEISPDGLPGRRRCLRVLGTKHKEDEPYRCVLNTEKTELI